MLQELCQQDSQPDNGTNKAPLARMLCNPPHKVFKQSDQIRGNFNSVSLFSWSQISSKNLDVVSMNESLRKVAGLLMEVFTGVSLHFWYPQTLWGFVCAAGFDQDCQSQTHLPLLCLPSLRQSHSSDKLFPFPLFSLTHHLNLCTTKKCQPKQEQWLKVSSHFHCLSKSYLRASPLSG